MSSCRPFAFSPVPSTAYLIDVRVCWSQARLAAQDADRRLEQQLHAILQVLLNNPHSCLSVLVRFVLLTQPYPTKTFRTFFIVFLRSLRLLRAKGVAQAVQEIDEEAEQMNEFSPEVALFPFDSKNFRFVTRARTPTHRDSRLAANVTALVQMASC
jgi:hypothetical protein